MNREETMDELLELYGKTAYVIMDSKNKADIKEAKRLQAKVKENIRDLVNDMMADAYKVGWAKCKKDVVELLKKEAKEREEKEKKLWK